MRKNRDKFAELNKTKHTGKIAVVAIAVVAFCITGILCARKLQQNERYITMQVPQGQAEEI